MIPYVDSDLIPSLTSDKEEKSPLQWELFIYLLLQRNFPYKILINIYFSGYLKITHSKLKVSLSRAYVKYIISGIDFILVI